MRVSAQLVIQMMDRNGDMKLDKKEHGIQISKMGADWDLTEGTSTIDRKWIT